MSRRDKPDASDASALEAIGVRPGEAVRFRRADRSRWQTGSVDRLERDGSLRITDADGAARTVPLAQVQVRVTRRGRGGSTGPWEPLADRAARAVQLTLSW